MEIIHKIKTEENIDYATFLEFSRSISLPKGNDIYYRGLDLLKDSTEEEKLCAFADLFKLAEADDDLNARNT
jgi:hypothetical protein